jgi:tetraacyldisaccharide 4'-kinase
MRAPDFWRRGAGHPLARAATPLAALYGAGVALRAALARPAAAPIPVLCVGALTVGGAGKTPTALALARRLAAAGRAVHLVSRGYGGRLAGPLRVDPDRHDAVAVGDEPLLLAAAAPCWVARDRNAGVAAAAAAGAALALLDDGFQNPTIAKAWSLLVIDGEQGFGDGRLLPAGPLREPPRRGLARADAVLLIGEDRAGVGAALPAGRPLLRGDLVPALPAALAGRRLLAFAGIGRPDKFFAMLAGLPVELVDRVAFADHHPYAAAEVERLIERAARQGAVAVTTAKDMTRVPAALRPRIAAVGVELVWRDPAALDRLLAAARLG